MSHVGWLIFILVVGIGADKALTSPPSARRFVGISMIIAAVIVLLFAYGRVMVTS